MAMKEMVKNFIRDQVYMRLKGPGTGWLSSAWNALLSARVDSEPGHTQ